MPKGLCFTPSNSLLDQFGFVPGSLIGFYEAHKNPFLLSVLVVCNGEASLYEQPEPEEDDSEIGDEEVVYRFKGIVINNDDELIFLLNKVLVA